MFKVIMVVLALCLAFVVGHVCYELFDLWGMFISFPISFILGSEGMAIGIGLDND